MIIFHEGMPRAGKSYAAMADHIIPALQKGRMVYARIDGLDHEKIALAAGVELERVNQLLVELTEQQVHHLPQIEIQQDSLVVIDELQNYWPQGKAQLPPEIVKWVAEHGHHGLDVLCMGQLLKDCHRTWVNRTNRKIQFIKKDVLGKPNEYKWIMYTGSPDSRGNVKFVEVQKGDSPYDKKYFGCYKSHSEGTENTETYSDDRVVIWNSPIFRKWLPIMGIIALVSIGYLVHLFSGGLAPAPTAKAENKVKPVSTVETVTTSGPGQETKTVVTRTDGAAAAAVTKPAEEKRADFEMPDLVGELSKDNRIRLAAVLRSAKATRVVVEFRDASLRVVEQLTAEQLETLGWHVLTTNDNRMAVLSRPGKQMIATMWPVAEAVAKVTEDQTQQIKRESRRMMPQRDDYNPESNLKETAPISLADSRR